MKNDLIWLALALITGALIPIQAATNAVFSKNIGSPLITGLMVFVIGLDPLRQKNIRKFFIQTISQIILKMHPQTEAQ